MTSNSQTPQIDLEKFKDTGFYFYAKDNVSAMARLVLHLLGQGKSQAEVEEALVQRSDRIANQLVQVDRLTVDQAIEITRDLRTMAVKLARIFVESLDQ